VRGEVHFAYPSTDGSNVRTPFAVAVVFTVAEDTTSVAKLTQILELSM
jgi:hypothetical protein